jgi:rRNA maturation endonuclease Nob1
VCPPSEPEEPPLTVCVVDSSAIIQLKVLVNVDQQWDVFDRMIQLTREGRIAFPRQVYREIAREKHTDMPGGWAGKAKSLVCYPDPSDDTLAAIGASLQGLVEEDAELDNEPADPYVVAMAYDLANREPPYDVAVVTDDVVDRLPIRIALKTACDRLSIPCWSSEHFLNWLRHGIAGPPDSL